MPATFGIRVNISQGKLALGSLESHEKAADHARARISVAARAVSLKAAARKELYRRTSIKGRGKTATISSPSR